MSYTPRKLRPGPQRDRARTVRENRRSLAREIAALIRDGEHKTFHHGSAQSVPVKRQCPAEYGLSRCFLREGHAGKHNARDSATAGVIIWGNPRYTLKFWNREAGDRG